MYSKYLLTLIIGLVTLLTVPAFAQKMSSDDLLKKALRETNINQNYPLAISLAEAGLKISPEYLDIRMLLGRLYLLTGRYDEGTIELNKVLAKDPQNKNALNYLFNASFEKQKYNDALAYSSRYLEYYPLDNTAVLKRAGVYFELKEYKKAMSTIASAMLKSPADTNLKTAFRDYTLNYATILRKQNDLENAAIEYGNVLRLDPLNEVALNALFNLSVQTGKNENALIYAAALERSASPANISLKKADLLKTMGRYDDAAIVANALISKNPGDSSIVFLYKDILFSKGKYNMQKGDTANALVNYNAILTKFPSDTTARNLVININLERKNYASAMNYINSGIQFYNDQPAILTKKLELLRSSGQLKEAYLLSDSLVRNNITSSEIERFRDEVFVLSRQNRIGLSTSLTMFDQKGRDPWTVYSLFYMRQQSKISIVGRVNYADRVNFQGYQFELDLYPKHKNSYSFLNLAYSDSRVFPKFKFSYSYFLPLWESWESELGFRYLNAGSEFKGFTGALGKYFNKYWLSFKTFQTSSNGNLVGSYIINNRYYLKDNSDDYLMANFGYGFSPEDVARNFDFVERVTLESLRFTLGYQQTILKRGILGLFGTWNKQEYTPGKKRNEYDVSVSFQHKF